MMNGKKSLGMVLGAIMALALTTGLAGAAHVRMSEPRPAAFPTIDHWPPLAPAMLRAGEIKAQQVQAHTIYADRIEADDIQGVIYQTPPRDLKPGGKGELKAPEISAAVIYADRIQANSVVADIIYVRHLPGR